MHCCPEIVLDSIQVLSSTTSKRWPQFFHLSGKKNLWPSAEKNGDKNLWTQTRLKHSFSKVLSLWYIQERPLLIRKASIHVPFRYTRCPQCSERTFLRQFSVSHSCSLSLSDSLSLFSLFMLEIAKIFGSIIKSTTATKHWMETNGRRKNFIQNQLEYQVSR